MTRKIMGRSKAKTIIATVRAEATLRLPLHKANTQRNTGVNRTANTVEKIKVWINGAIRENPRYRWISWAVCLLKARKKWMKILLPMP